MIARWTRRTVARWTSPAPPSTSTKTPARRASPPPTSSRCSEVAPSSRRGAPGDGDAREGSGDVPPRSHAACTRGRLCEDTHYALVCIRRTFAIRYFVVVPAREDDLRHGEFILGSACNTRTSRAQRAALTPPVRIEGADFRPGMATPIAMTSTSSSFALGASPSRPRRVAPSPSPVRPRHRRWTTTTTMTSASAPGGVKANVNAEPPTPPIPAAADRLEILLAEPYATLGDAVRAPNDLRAAIVACVS